MEDNVFFCLCTFCEGGPTYGFKTYISDLVPGDHIIVSARGEWQCVTFVEYVKHFTMKKCHGDGRPDEDCPEMVKPVIAKIDPVTYRNVFEKEYFFSRNGR